MFRRNFAATLLAASTLTAGLAHAEEATDHAMVSRFPGSTIKQRSAKAFDEYGLVLGPTKAGQFTKTQHMEGRVTRIWYNTPPSASTLKMFRSYRQALTRAGFQTLFTCSGPECGEGVVDLQEMNIGRWCISSMDCPEPMRFLAAKLSGATGHAALYGIYFDTAKAEIKPPSKPALDEIARLLALDPALKLHIVGHTDNVGVVASNLTLSKARANAVVQALVSGYKIVPARLTANGVGSLAPVGSNASEDRRAKNRRVEIVAQ